MIDTKQILPAILSYAQSADLSAIRSFLTTNPAEPFVAIGSGGAESAADLAALLYGARGGLSVAVSPYTLNSFSDETLKTGKVLLVSRGGHNNDIVYATRRALKVNPGKSAALNFSCGDRNDARKLFLKAGSELSFYTPMPRSHEGFVSTGTAFSYFSILTRIFQPDVDLEKYKMLPEKPYTLCRNDDSPLTPADFAGVKSYLFLHGSWGRPVAKNLEGKAVETGLATGCICDYRNYCHGRFIFTSNQHDAPEASLDLLIRATEFFHAICTVYGQDPTSPGNPGRIDKRVPMWVPFMAEMKKYGPLSWS